MGSRISFVDEHRVSLAAPFPTEPQVITHENADGSKIEVFLSPPVQVGKKAHRYRATRTTAPDGAITVGKLYHESTGGWKGYVSKENWAAMALRYPSFDWTTHFDGKVPQALALRWTEAAERFRHAHDPEALAARVKEIERWKAYRKQRASRQRDRVLAHEARFGKLEHGDVAIVESPLSFDERTLTSQVFVMLRDTRPGSRLSPYIARHRDGRITFIPVRIPRATYATFFMKAGSAAFAATKLSHHAQIETLQLAALIARHRDAGTLTPFGFRTQR